MKRIIGLGHYSRTGKDTFAKYLIEELAKLRPDLRIGRVGQADKLKDVAHQLYGWAGLKSAAYYETLDGAADRDVVIQPIGKTPVQIWVDLGTPAVRDNVYQKTWIDYVLFHELPKYDVMLITDIRFPNEVQEYKKFDAHMIKVVRPGFGPRPTVADQALVGVNWFDNIIGDEGSMESLHQWAKVYARRIAGNDEYPRRCISDLEQALTVEKLS